MRVGVVFALIVFVLLFLLFWNIKRWKWSVAKMVATSAACAVVSGGVVGGIIYFLILIG